MIIMREKLMLICRAYSIAYIVMYILYIILIGIPSEVRVNRKETFIFIVY